MYFNFLRIQYRLGAIDETHLEQAVTKGLITEEQKAEMLFSNPSITVLETVEEANAVIDSLY